MDAGDIEGKSELHWAATEGHAAVAELLLEKKVAWGAARMYIGIAINMCIYIYIYMFF